MHVALSSVTHGSMENRQALQCQAQLNHQHRMHSLGNGLDRRHVENTGLGATTWSAATRPPLEAFKTPSDCPVRASCVERVPGLQDGNVWEGGLMAAMLSMPGLEEKEYRMTMRHPV